MTLLFIYLGVAIGVSFLCSILEAVLLSVTPSFVEQLKSERPSSAARLVKVKENMDSSLSSILILNTFCSHNRRSRSRLTSRSNIWSKMGRFNCCFTHIGHFVPFGNYPKNSRRISMATAGHSLGFYNYLLSQTHLPFGVSIHFSHKII